ncbi:ShlB/FhaC/HecB family hemolysin secretion/activation protein [Pantoea sp. 18069]|uniref:ShlB/FhaC/HecB family hemolysin secretion/activation protein n=1 Tax=Pantoea sp. 18069 TaxID=2681415 RepID=UPI0013590854|nr:ShlB/FhaC/HecB family hemolysin secretion/activation protein [Pantoea sp. 18069]
MSKRLSPAIFLCTFVCSSTAAAQLQPVSPALPAVAPEARLDQLQQQRQQERERALRERIAPDVDVLQEQPKAQALEMPEDESPCFPLHEIRITGAQSGDVPWLQDAAGLDLRRAPCIGAKGVEIILARMQHALVARGFITSRVMVVPQNLQNGVLEIAFLPGVLRDVRLSPDSAGDASILSALPSRRGELLQLRDIEQGLENLKRVPTADADIQIVPAEGPGVAPGQSDLLVSYRKSTPFRLNLALDDGGTKATGKLQGTATLSWDNPLLRNDLIYLSLGRGIRNGDRRGTENLALHYSVPLDYWLLGLTGSSNRYHQTVAGAYEEYAYSGESSQLDAKLSRVIHRNAWSRTIAGVRAFHRASSNFIDDTEIDVQRRSTAGYELSLAQRSYLGAALFEGNLAFKRGTGAFGALHAPEELWGEGTSRMKLYIADLALTRPFEVAGKRLRFSTAWHGQWNKTALTPQDRIGIGGRYTVRGFDGESNLLAERGRTWRNEIGLPLNAHAEAFLALDTGRVSGPSAEYLVGRSLAGAAIGLRGAGSGFSYEVFLATPVRKPEHFRTAHTNVAFSLAYSF